LPKLKTNKTKITKMKTTLILLSCAMPFFMISCGSEPTEVHNITVVKKPVYKPKPRPDRPEDFRATTTPR